MMTNNIEIQPLKNSPQKFEFDQVSPTRRTVRWADEYDEYDDDMVNVVPIRIRSSSKSAKCLVSISIISLFVGLMIIHLNRDVLNVSLAGKNKLIDSSSHLIINDQPSVITCPNNVRKADNDKQKYLTEFYERFNHNHHNMETINFNALKNDVFDGWDESYNERRKMLYEWKSEYFTSLQSGDSIFESACGIGLNLVLTVDILKESANIENLQLYGIEYVTQSVTYANSILTQVLPQIGNNATLGSPICKGDATDLFFIQSNAFDLAYTGYIDPIQDPLNFHIELGRKVKDSDLCKKVGSPTEKGKLDQAAVEDWYARWVSELVRITKPGKPIIVEQVSQPKCVDLSDWGGVSNDWWSLGVKKYNWDVDVNSIVIKELIPGSKNKRYNVFMRKMIPS